ncbi:ubiquitin carboxyl-terminal hydrolase 8 [Citrus sinensis]|uniref:ubiquitin carboxyl-terminal hydrolase 8 isoform X1 n=1 Tax=Citrus sinensis TaxID=2711 RepID=UPI00218E986A|nr:ubiquitin carboxyl-terminal hydrolase 8 isoform X1 [Citrus sinensis]KAH9659451.1 ubiquitin carboxyl-terminal hydrolase 8 [Citrus sinensis]
MGALAEDHSDSTHRVDSDNSSSNNNNNDNDQRVYLVPYRWWRDAQESTSRDSDKKRGVLYTATQGTSYGGPMKIINNIFNSDLVFNLRREEEVSLQNGENGEVGVSGRDYALVPGEMWLQALKWHSDTKVAAKNGKSFLASEDDMADVYPLQLRLSVMRETNSLGVKISKKDNAVELFKRACKIFSIESELLHIWDFSGQTTLYFLNDKNKFSKDCLRPSDHEILLELQIYGLSDSLKCREGRKDEMAVQHSNGSLTNGGFGIVRNSSMTFSGRSGEAGCLGLTGLQNLGNTCFMNSALQCLVHTPKLVDYFLGDYFREINHDNPLGMDGEIALAFGDLLRKLWAPGAAPVSPRTFKSKLARFAPQFSGFNQHDSQELLAFLLDGLHEDLNRVKCKPYAEAKDGDGRSDEDIADEYWQNHLARNDSIIVDLCQGQYKSTLVCPVCKKVSVTFDPFMYLSLPLPSTTVRMMTLTVVNTDGTAKPSPFTITVPKYGKFEDLIRALSIACALGVNETLLVAEIYNHRIIRYLEEPADSISLIRDDDQLVAYRLRKENDKDPLVVFMHQQLEEQYIHGKLTSCPNALGIPLVAKISNLAHGLDIRNLYLELLKPFCIPAKDTFNNNVTAGSTAIEEVTQIVDNVPFTGGVATPSSVKEVEPPSDAELQFYLTDEKGIVKNSKIVMNEPIAMTGVPEEVHVVVCWSGKLIEQYDTRLLSSLPEIFKSGFLPKRPQESVSLYKCLEAFLTEEPLGPEDMWYCPGCKKHCQASKKLDLWRLPEILVIHLKRFSYSRFSKNKLETYVDFPVDNLDLSTHVAHLNDKLSNRYMLYAVSNHYGSMGGGHYTAFVHHGGGQWYDFDDSHVYPISQDKIKTSAAYVLFYRRVVEVS